MVTFLYPNHLNVAVLFIPGPFYRDLHPHRLCFNNSDHKVEIQHNHCFHKAITPMPFTANGHLIGVLKSNISHLTEGRCELDDGRW